MKKTASASRPLARISLKDSNTLFSNIRNKPTSKAKRFLQDLIDQKKNLDGRYFTKASQEIKDLIEEVEKNAESLGLDAERLFIKNKRFWQ